MTKSTYHKNKGIISEALVHIKKQFKTKDTKLEAFVESLENAGAITGPDSFDIQKFSKYYC